MAVYLLHSNVPLTRSNGEQVIHYVGHAPDGQVHRRLEDHRKNRSSTPLVQEWLKRGACLSLGRVWRGETYGDEQRRKRAGHLSRSCLVCQRIALEERLEALAIE